MLIRHSTVRDSILKRVTGQEYKTTHETTRKRQSVGEASAFLGRAYQLLATATEHGQILKVRGDRYRMSGPISIEYLIG